MFAPFRMGPFSGNYVRGGGLDRNNSNVRLLERAVLCDVNANLLHTFVPNVLIVIKQKYMNGNSKVVKHTQQYIEYVDLFASCQNVP